MRNRKIATMFCCLIVMLLTSAAPASEALFAIVDAINSRNVNMVNNMLLADSAGNLVRERDAMGRTILHFAAGQGDVRILRAVLSRRPDVNALTHSGQTPLIYAANGTYNDNTRLLLAAGADVNLADNTGMTPLIIASDKGKPDLVQILPTAGATANAANENGTNALMYAAERGNQKLVQTLLGGGADMTRTDKQGNTPLHYAARRGRREVVSLMVQLINVRNSAGQSPLDVAMVSGQQSFAQEIQKFGGAIGTR